MNKPAVAAEMIEYLSARIFAGNYEPGGRIPSVRALMRKFHLSYGSTLNGISYLCENGLLEKHPKSGVTVSRHPCPAPPENGRCIGVLTSTGNRPNRGLVYEALAEIQQAAAEFQLPLVAVSGPFDALFPVLEKCSVVIVMTELEETLKELPFTAPAVGLFQSDDFNGQMSIVDLDPYQAARVAVDFFRERVRRVTVLTDPQPVYRHRGRIFEYLWHEAGGECTGFIASSYAELTECEFRDGEGYLFTSDHQLQHYVGQRRKAGDGGFPEFAVMLGLDGKSLLVPEFEKYPTVAADWRWIGRVAFEEALARMEHPRRPARRIYCPGKLILPGGDSG